MAPFCQIISTYIRSAELVVPALNTYSYTHSIYPHKYVSDPIWTYTYKHIHIFIPMINSKPYTYVYICTYSYTHIHVPTPTHSIVLLLIYIYIYQPLCTSRMWHKVNFLSRVIRFKFRVFLPLDHLSYQG